MTEIKGPRPDVDPGGVNKALTGLFGRDAIYMALWALQVMGAALVTPLVTRLMPQEQFGVLATANAVMQVLAVLAGVGLATAIQRQHAQGGARAARKLFTVATLAALLLTAVFYTTGPLWSTALGFTDFSGVLKLVVVWAGTSAVTNCGLALLRSQDRLFSFGLVSLVQSVVAEGTSLLLVDLLRVPAALLFVLGQVLAQLVAMALALVLAVPALPLRADLPLVRRGLRFGLPLVPYALSAFVLGVADRLVLQKILGPAPVGGYQLAYNVGSAPMLLLSLLSTAWLPRLFGLGSDRAAVLAASRNAIYRLLPAIVLGMAAGGPLILRVWAPASYHPDELRLTLVLIVVSVVPHAASLAATRTLLVGGHTSAVAICNMIAAILNVLLNVVLVPHLQLVGSALATLVAYSVQWVALLIRSGRELRVPPAPALLTVALLTAGAVAIASSGLPVGDGFLMGRILLVIASLFCLGLMVHRVRHNAGLEQTNLRSPAK